MALYELEQFKPPAILGFIRSVFDVPPPAFQGSKWLPNATTDQLDFSYILGASSRPAMATILSFDAEAPLAQRPGLGARIEGELPPIKRKTRIGEKEIINFLSPRQGSGDVQSAIDSVYDDFADLVESVQQTQEWLTTQALSAPTLVYSADGVTFSFDFGMRNDLKWNIATKKDGNGATIDVGGPWNDPVTATYVHDLQVLQNYLRNTYGFTLDEITVPGQIVANLQQSTEIRALVLGTAAGTPNRLLTPGEVDAIFTQYQLPRLVANDVTVVKEAANGSLSTVRTLATNRGFGYPQAGLGNFLIGPTAESRILYGTRLQTSAPGIWGETYSKDEPPAEFTKVAMVGFPSIPLADRVVQLQLF